VFVRSAKGWALPGAQAVISLAAAAA